MPLVTLAQLVTPVTQAAALNIELSYAQSFGLQTSTWQPLDPSRTIFQINAAIVAQWSTTINLTAQGGFASYAATMTDSSGNPITSWMDLVSFNNYNVLRFQATNAAGSVPVSVGGTSPALTWSPNAPIRFQNPASPFATYTSTGSGTISPGTSGVVAAVADASFAGSAGSATLGTVLILLTPRTGVTVQALGSQATTALVGTTQETNAALLTRCQAKLGSLSSLTALQAASPNPAVPVPIAPGGAPGAYYYVATSIPVGTQSAVWPYYVTSQITRCTVSPNLNTGTVNVYIANAAGAPSSGDVGVITAAIQAMCVPQAVTCAVTAASTVTVNVTCSVWIKASAGISPAQAQTSVQSALASLFSTVPIGGYNVNGGILPIAALEDAIFNANTGTVDVSIALPAADTTLAASQVAVLGNVTTVVNLV